MSVSVKDTQVCICLSSPALHCCSEPDLGLIGDALKLRDSSSLKSFPSVLLFPGWAAGEHFCGKQASLTPLPSPEQAKELLGHPARCAGKTPWFFDQSPRQTRCQQTPGRRAQGQRKLEKQETGGKKWRKIPTWKGEKGWQEHRITCSHATVCQHPHECYCYNGATSI